MYSRHERRNDDGSIISVSEKHGTILKEGWFIMYKDSVLDFVANAPNLTVTKVWLFILAHQSYDVYVNVTQSYIAKKMNLSRPEVSRAVKWLEENGYLRKINECGQRKFLINPSISSCGRAAVAERKLLWSNNGIRSEDVLH